MTCCSPSARGVRETYQGDSRTFVDAFDQCRTDKDREQWVHQLAAYLRGEIEPQLWQELDTEHH
jgi:hypothetical protein